MNLENNNKFKLYSSIELIKAYYEFHIFMLTFDMV